MLETGHNVGTSHIAHRSTAVIGSNEELVPMTSVGVKLEEITDHSSRQVYRSVVQGYSVRLPALTPLAVKQ